MKTKSTIVAMAVGLLSMVSSAYAGVINFDDISLAPNVDVRVATDYHGFTWSDFYALNTTGDLYDQSGYVPGTTSPGNVGFSLDEKQASFSSASAFTLNSFDLTAAWRAGMTVTVQGSGSNGINYVEALTPSAMKATHYTLNWVGINKVTFEATGGNPYYTNSNSGAFAGGVGSNFAIDNITFNEQFSAAVPEPESYAMFLAGLGALGFIGRRRRSQG
jgi:hypothetical protein